MGRNNECDIYIMLLSSDWFSPYLYVILGQNYDSTNHLGIQAAARNSVKHIMGESEIYWLVDFSKSRLTKTLGVFVENMKKEKVHSETIIQLKKLLAFFDQNVHRKTIWSFWSIVMQSKSGLLTDMPSFDGLMSGVLEKLGCDEMLENDFERIASESTTQWDGYLRSITPDLPTLISDFVESEMITLLAFKRFWEDVEGVLNENQRKELIAWFKNTAISQIGGVSDIKCPAWLES